MQREIGAQILTRGQEASVGVVSRPARAEAVVDTSNHTHVVRQLRRVRCTDIVVPGGRPWWDQAIVDAVDAAVAVEIKLHVLILDIHVPDVAGQFEAPHGYDRRSEEHTSELQSLMRNSYAVFCL